MNPGDDSDPSPLVVVTGNTVAVAVVGLGGVGPAAHGTATMTAMANPILPGHIRRLLGVYCYFTGSRPYLSPGRIFLDFVPVPHQPPGGDP
jgi:hypothetical protein